MAILIYATSTSLDGYIADETGNPDWAAPDEEGFAFINDLLRPIGLVSLWTHDVRDDGERTRLEETSISRSGRPRCRH
jgi:hypothetical protein